MAFTAVGVASTVAEEDFTAAPLVADPTVGVPTAGAAATSMADITVVDIAARTPLADTTADIAGATDMAMDTTATDTAVDTTAGGEVVTIRGTVAGDSAPTSRGTAAITAIRAIRTQTTMDMPTRIAHIRMRISDIWLLRR